MLASLAVPAKGAPALPTPSNILDDKRAQAIEYYGKDLRSAVPSYLAAGLSADPGARSRSSQSYCTKIHIHPIASALHRLSP